MLSPAKINLGLQILHRRPTDNRHFLYSIFIPISFGDEISFEAAAEHTLESSNELPPGNRDEFEKVSERGDLSSNLLWTILSDLKSELSGGVKIKLIKRIPTGAGLGGGSSNAGMLLRYLQEHFSIPTEKIQAAARKHGSDITFFLNQGAQQVYGTGDEMQPIEVGGGYGVLCLSNFGISTAFAYKELKRGLQPTIPPETWPVLSEKAFLALKDSKWSELKGFTNDFEGVVFSKYPELEKSKGYFLENGADYASLTGTGSTLFALVSNESKQVSLQKKMEELLPELRFVSFRF